MADDNNGNTGNNGKHGMPDDPGDADVPREPRAPRNTPEDGTRHFGANSPSNRDQAAAERIQRVLDAHYASDAAQSEEDRRFTVSRVVGRGGMSTVWLAYDAVRERDVAIKVLKPELTDDPEFRDRFRQEAESAETIDSDNVVATYDYGEQPNVDGTGVTYCFIVMEYVQGESLADILARQRTLPEVMALDLIAQAAVGLQAIHSRNLIHRDIKPGNLMVTADGVVKVTDFGIAKAASAVPLTRTGMVVGTAQYVSPEQAQGLTIEPSSDVYSLGVVGYEILEGHRPFAGDSTVSVALKHINEPAPELPDTVSPAMRQLIAICLRKDPSTRYQDGAALAAATVPVRDGQMPPDPASGAMAAPTEMTARPTTGEGSANLAQVTDESNMGPDPTTGGKKNNRGKWWILALIVALLAALALLGWAVYSNRDSEDEPAPTPTQTETITSEITEEQTVEPPPETSEPEETSTPTETQTESDTPTSPPEDSPTSTPTEPETPSEPDSETPSEPTVPSDPSDAIDDLLDMNPLDPDASNGAAETEGDSESEPDETTMGPM